MPSNQYSSKSYYELSKHNVSQVVFFLFLTTLGMALVFVFLMPMIEEFFKNFLSGQVYNQGEKISYMIDSKQSMHTTNYFTNWAVDIYKNTPQESRYWFNPILSFISVAFIIGLFLAISLSALMPTSAGFIRQKIEREIANFINQIAANYLGSTSNQELSEIANLIKSADLQQMHEYMDDWDIQLEDLKILQRALIWQDSNLFYKLIHLNDGLTMYMRFYFTMKYNNAVLGFVYIGAAILIIIVGLRGLKFVPPTQPSIVLFALGLEFTLLVTYAFTLMYTRQDEDMDNAIGTGGSAINSDSLFMSSDFGTSREIEKLLRVFIKSSPKKPGK